MASSITKLECLKEVVNRHERTNRCMKTTLSTTFIKNGSLKVRRGVGVIDSEALNRSLGLE